MVSNTIQSHTKTFIDKGKGRYSEVLSRHAHKVDFWVIPLCSLGLNI